MNEDSLARDRQLLSIIIICIVLYLLFGCSSYQPPTGPENKQPPDRVYISEYNYNQWLGRVNIEYTIKNIGGTYIEFYEVIFRVTTTDGTILEDGAKGFDLDREEETTEEFYIVVGQKTTETVEIVKILYN
jgi:hypothetical protein